VFIVFSCLGLLSIVFSVSFGFVYYYIGQVIGWDTTLVISFVWKGYPYKDQIDELFIVMVYCMYSQHITWSTISLISLFKLQHTYQKHDIAYFC